MDLFELTREVTGGLAPRYSGVEFRLEKKGDTAISKPGDSLGEELKTALARVCDEYPYGLSLSVTVDGRDASMVRIVVELSGREITTDVDLRSSNIDTGPRQLLSVPR